MYTSDIEYKKAKTGKMIFTYLAITIFCAIFSYTYEQFGHGVYSNYMIYLFLFPLIGGVIPFLIIRTNRHIVYPGQFSINIYNSGIATLTVGSCLKGVLDIYGTSSGYISIYWIAGSLFLVLGVMTYIFSKKFSLKNKY